MNTEYSRLILIFFVFLMFGAFASNADAVSLAKVTVKVVDEEGKPVEAAQVRIRFQGGTLQKDAVIGVTNSEGVFSASGSSTDGVVGGGVNKEGYYKSVLHYDFHRNALSMWQPWNKEMKVILRPIINPVPMYARDRWLQIPYLNKKIGFDLIKFDWVMPYGQGMQSDLIFLLTRRFNNMNDFDATLTITFANKYDGIQETSVDRSGDFNIGSEFLLPRYAPESGYQKTFEKIRSTRSKDFYAIKEKHQNYFFRVRSEVDENGNLKRAMYGKITEEITIDPRGNKTGETHIRFYLNPDYTRNLEYDPKRNLFNPLPNGERPLAVY